MASTNQSPEYIAAEKRYLLAETDEERLECLREMLKHVPKHKAGESMRANLRTRYKKLKESIEKQKKSKKSSQETIKKAEMQIVLAGFPNTGKSTLFNLLTNKNSLSKESEIPYTTYKPEIGTTEIEDIQIQTLDLQPFPNHDKNLLNSTDLILLIIDDLTQIAESKKFIKNASAKIILIFNKTDLLNENEKRKITENLKSKHKNFEFLLFNKNEEQKTSELKKLILDEFIPKKFIRIYTKEPKKPLPKNSKPLITKTSSTVEQVAEKILKGLSKKTKKAKIWGPSSKFPGQSVGLNHELKDKDILELQTK